MIYELCTRSSAKCVMYDVFSAHPPPAQPQTPEMHTAAVLNSGLRLVRRWSIRFLEKVAQMHIEGASS